MSFKDRIKEIISLENKKTEIVAIIFSLLIQAISLMIIISDNEFLEGFVFWVLLIPLSIFLTLIIIFQFLSIELTIESMRITLLINPEYDGSIFDLFSELDVPSVTPSDSNIIFENLNFSIQNNSKSLVMQTSQRSEKEISRMYGDLNVFRQRFREISNNSENLTIKNLNTYCEIDLIFERIKTLNKNKGNRQENTFDLGLTVIKTEDKIKITIPEECVQKSWKDLKKNIMD